MFCKQQRKHYGRPAHDSQTSLEGNLGKHIDTAESYKTLAESKAHHHREVNRSQTWPTKATWARRDAGVFMSDPGLKSHGCWIQKVALCKSVKTGHIMRQ